jgi:hypothetical protein
MLAGANLVAKLAVVKVLDVKVLTVRMAVVKMVVVKKVAPVVDAGLAQVPLVGAQASRESPPRAKLLAQPMLESALESAAQRE